MINWIKGLLYIVRHYNRDFNRMCHYQDEQNVRIKFLQKELELTNALMRERTEVHTDIPTYKGYPSTIVVCGKYKNKDYVEIFQVKDSDFIAIVELLREVNRHANVRHIDTSFQLKYVIDKELNRGD